MVVKKIKLGYIGMIGKMFIMMWWQKLSRWKNHRMVKGLESWCEGEKFKSSHMQLIWMCLASLVAI
jgi:hypothetical protein